MRNILIKLILLICFVCTLTFAEEKSYTFDFGLRYKDVIGNRYKVSEYDYFKKEKLFPYFGFEIEKHFWDDKYFSLDGKFINEYNQKYNFDLDFGRVFKLEGSYIDFFHSIWRDTIVTSNITTTGSYAVDNLESLESLTEYGRRYIDWKVAASIIVPEVPQAKVNLSFREQRKRGAHQGSLFANCGSCHFYTVTRPEDRTTRDFKAGIEGKVIDGVNVEYSYENRQFTENEPGAPLPTGASSTYTQSATKFDFTPNQTANIHEVQARIDLPMESTAYGSYALNDHRNADNANTIKTNSANARITNNSIDDLTFSLYYNQVNEVNDVDYTYGTATTNNIVVSKSHYTTANAEGLDLHISKVGLDTSYSAPCNTVVRVKVESEKNQRDDFSHQPASTIDALAKVSVLSTAFKNAPIQLRYTFNTSNAVGYAVNTIRSHKGFLGISWNPMPELSITPNIDYFYGIGDNNYERREMNANLMFGYMTGENVMLNASYSRANSWIRKDLLWILKYGTGSGATNTFGVWDYGKYYTDQSDAFTVGATYALSPECQLDLNAHYILGTSVFETSLEDVIVAGKTFNWSDVPGLSKISTVITGFSVGSSYDFSRDLMLSISYSFNKYQDISDATWNGTDHSLFGGIAYKF